MYIKRPRLRYDGLFVSICSYLRPGATEFSYYQPVHRVRYFRFLRFYENGMVISTMTTEEPKKVLGWFKLEFTSDENYPTRYVRKGVYEFNSLNGDVEVTLKDSRKNLKHVTFFFFFVEYED